MKPVLSRPVRVLILPVLLVIALGAGSQTTPPPEIQDNPPPKRPETDYMRSFLSQNTKPLGFTEDKTLQRLLLQPPITWAIRASGRHILD